MNNFELNVLTSNDNATTVEAGQSFELNCKAIDGKPFTSIRLYRNDYLIAESSNYINYLGDQFMNTTSILSSKGLVEFNKSIVNLNNLTMNKIEQKLSISKLNLKDSGSYQCFIQTPFGNATKRFKLKIIPTNSTVYQQVFDLIKVPNFLMMFNSSLILIAILIYLTNYNSIEMNNRLKHIQIHLWIQILLLINLFYYSSTKHFSTSKLNCELYGLMIYYFMISILFTTLLSSIYLYKQLTKCTTASLNNKSSKHLTNDKRNNQSNLANLANQEFNLQSEQHDELISEQILMYQQQQPKNYCIQFVNFLFHHYTVRYHALNTSLTLLVVLVFGLFNLNQFKTSSRCFANVLLVSNFYIFIPFLMLIIGQFSVFFIVHCAIKRFYMIHKKLEQRDTACLSLKEHVLDQQHSTHVNNCLSCFRAHSKLDMYWTSSHFYAQAINFLLYLILLILIILTVVSQDTNMFKIQANLPPNSYWWLPSTAIASKNFKNESNPIILNNSTEFNQIKNLKDQIQANELRSSPSMGESRFDKDIKLDFKAENNHTNVQFKKLNPTLIDEQWLISIYLFCTFLLAGHILLHYCFARKDIREALKSFLVKTFCLYACDCCMSNRRCCNTGETTSKKLRTDRNRYVSTLVPGIILNQNSDVQSCLLFNQQAQKQLYNQQQQYGFATKQQPLLFEEKDEDELYEETENNDQMENNNIQLDGFDILPTNGLYKLGNENFDFKNENTKNAFKSTVNSYQDGVTTVRLLNTNDQLLSSESNTTTSSTIVTNTGGSSISNSALSNHNNDLFNAQINNQISNQFNKPKTNITLNREHIYYENATNGLSSNPRFIGNDYKASFDDVSCFLMFENNY